MSWRQDSSFCPELAYIHLYFYHVPSENLNAETDSLYPVRRVIWIVQCTIFVSSVGDRFVQTRKMRIGDDAVLYIGFFVLVTRLH